jgi:hypothetical protein
MDQVLGSCIAILDGLSTKVDGSVTIKVNIDPSNQELITNLMKLWSESNRSMAVAFTRVD